MELTQEEVKIIHATLSWNEAKFHKARSQFDKIIKRHNSLSNIKIKSFKLRRLINKILERVKSHDDLQDAKNERFKVVVTLDKVNYRNTFESL